MTNKTILFIAPQPTSTQAGSNVSLTYWEHEYKAMQKALENKNSPSYFKLQVIPVATKVDLVQCSKYNPWLIHFCGHGIIDTGELAFETEGKKADIIKNEALFEFLKTLDNVECIVFSSCYSSYLLEETQKIFKYSIGFDENVKPNVTLLFVKEFYKHLELDKTATLYDAFNRTKKEKAAIKLITPDYSEPLFKSRTFYIMNNIIKEKKFELAEELTPEGRMEFEFLKRQVEFENDLIQNLESRYHDVEHKLEKLSDSQTALHEKLMHNHPFVNEVKWFIWTRENIADELSEIILPDESEELKSHYAKKLNRMFNFLEAALVAHDYDGLKKEYLMLRNLKFGYDKYADGFVKLNAYYIQKYKCSEEFAHFFEDKINYIYQMLVTIDALNRLDSSFE
jgi:CHAT domain